jgi:hypothetical protein
MRCSGASAHRPRSLEGTKTTRRRLGPLTLSNLGAPHDGHARTRFDGRREATRVTGSNGSANLGVCDRFVDPFDSGHASRRAAHAGPSNRPLRSSLLRDSSCLRAFVVPAVTWFCARRCTRTTVVVRSCSPSAVACRERCRRRRRCRSRCKTRLPDPTRAAAC